MRGRRQVLLMVATGLWLISAVSACGDDPPDEAGGGDAVVGTDEGAVPDTSVESDSVSEPDTGADPDVSGEPDVPDDPCAAAGCAAPPLCSTGCQAECGCCSCGSSDSYCGEQDGQAAAFVCNGGCYDVTPCGAGTCAIDADGPACGGVKTCADVEAEYLALSATVACSAHEDCSVLSGHCGVGVGGCYAIVNGSVGQADLDALAAEWTALGCSGPVCKCAPPPASAICDDTSGTCVAAEGGPCDDFVGLATAAEMEGTPKADAEAEVLAIEASGKFLAPEDVYARIAADLSAIRAQWPALAGVKAMASPPDQLLVGLDEPGKALAEAGEYTGWDCPNERYGVVDIEVASFYTLLKLSGRVDIIQLAAEYATLPNVDYAEPNFLAGDGNDVCAAVAADGEYRYVFDMGSGDCPAGCINHAYRAFSSTPLGDITDLGEWSNGPPPASAGGLDSCLKWL